MAAMGIYGQSIKKQSNRGYKETLRSVEYFIKDRQLSIFALHDRGRSRISSDAEMLPGAVIFFGNSMFGAPIILDNPIWNLHLPLKAAVFDDKEGRTWVAVPDLRAMTSKDKLTIEQEETIRNMSNLLDILLNIH